MLEEQYTEEDDLHEQMFDDHVFDAALEAMQWLNEDEDMSPSESWAPLVRK